MGPIRGLKRRKKTKNKVDQNVMVANSLGSQPQPLDWWDDFSQRITGPLSLPKNSMKFESFFKISRKTFSYICSLVEKDMMAKTTRFIDLLGKPLLLNDQVAVALRRLSSGESLSSIGYSLEMNLSTVSQITWRFVESMEERELHHLHWPSTERDMEKIKSKFEKISGLPNCCGAIETTHIMMTLPTTDKENDVWLDYEKNCSLILQAIVDSEMRFLNIITGWPGSLSDVLVLQSSGFFKMSEQGTRLNGVEFLLSKGTKSREYIVGDAGFPLLPWLLIPYFKKDLSNIQVEFNKRLYATLTGAQRALVRLKEMWKIIQRVMWKPDKNKLPRVILVCCILHNIVIDMGDEMQEEMTLSRQHDLGYKRQTCESADKYASILRENLSIYLFGRLPSQKNLCPYK